MVTTKDGAEVTLFLSEELRMKLEHVSKVEGKSMDEKVNDLLLSYFDSEGDESKG